MRILSFLSLLFLVGCQFGLPAFYVAEGTAYGIVDRAIRANDVVLLKRDGELGTLYMRSGYNKLFGPSPELAKNSKIGFWGYTTKNPRIQIYSNILVAHYGSYDFYLSPIAQRAYEIEIVKLHKTYSDETQFKRYEYVLRARAAYEEAHAEWRQELVYFDKQ